MEKHLAADAYPRVQLLGTKWQLDAFPGSEEAAAAAASTAEHDEDRQFHPVAVSSSWNALLDQDDTAVKREKELCDDLSLALYNLHNEQEKLEKLGPNDAAAGVYVGFLPKVASSPHLKASPTLHPRLKI
ncbi:hypothetical protein Ae201684_018699 [Aphanomyces euteiches]|uniref:Uncharacterized protein n=1 Tax=Aphanomyces euteiches TaxID=100861 RepID=A0A6G0W7H8_9STRA|nr:hypothetical protein Ae201684_018699 [Aphanomyces euteiches]